jgi:HK97 family phage prohead protease
MEIRSVDADSRTLVGMVVPYDEVSYLTADPGGERVARGAFTKSIRQRADRIPLLHDHNTNRVMGRSRRFDDTDDGLVGTFTVNDGDDGDRYLDDLRHGYMGGMSVGFHPLVINRDKDGVNVVHEGRLVEVSTVGLPAYEGAALLAVRSAQRLSDLLAPFANPPDVNLDPIGFRW